ncbi:MAG: hypothetical protein JSC085_000563 [Candidatus Tokpelaia sp. JSC085]|nr:MAG: hypothetical protein JSC085_000563 [Candidatus Tokpelaia sp. JSC085]
MNVKKNLKNLLFYSTATAMILGVSGAWAHTGIAIGTKEDSDVHSCDSYGAGYFYIPGTGTCMRITGSVRSEINGGKNVYADKRDERARDTYIGMTRATLRSYSASETDFGLLHTFLELRSDWIRGAEEGGVGGQLRYAYTELGGLHLGLDESIFHHWTGGFGNVMHDDMLNPLSSSRTNVISYTFNGSNGISAILGFEQGKNNNNSPQDGFRFNSNGTQESRKLRQQIEGYTPHVITGAKYKQGWGGISTVVAYDAYYSEFSGKMRFDIDINNQLSLWTMGGYKIMQDYYHVDESSTDNRIYRLANSIYGDWGGHWAFWSGGTYKLSTQTRMNFQLAYEAVRTFASSVNFSHELSPGLKITPELAYISWNDKYGFGDTQTSLKGKDALQGVIRLQRSF